MQQGVKVVETAGVTLATVKNTEIAINECLEHATVLIQVPEPSLDHFLLTVALGDPVRCLLCDGRQVFECRNDAYQFLKLGGFG